VQNNLLPVRPNEQTGSARVIADNVYLAVARKIRGHRGVGAEAFVDKMLLPQRFRL
jgi:hypothetical protein